ncbi:MAG: GNAT family N-acetyltransferase [Anaerolineae bacterium]|jgi:ribosomal protein S18 acetylase RimI-like enzyme
MAVIIRKATEADYRDLCIIFDEVDRMHRDELPRRFKAFEGPARPRNYIVNAIKAPDVGLFVAELEGQLVGFVHVTIKDMPPVPIFVQRRYASVDNLAVRRAHRRGGVGRALMKRAEAWAEARGATSVELNVYAFNQPAEDFYRSLGYNTLSHRMSKSLGTPEPQRKDG